MIEITWLYLTSGRRSDVVNVGGKETNCCFMLKKTRNEDADGVDEPNGRGQQLIGDSVRPGLRLVR